jgi:hypothetical protein
MELSARLNGVARRAPGARTLFADINSHNLTAGLTTATHRIVCVPVCGRLSLDDRAGVAGFRKV